MKTSIALIALIVFVSVARAGYDNTAPSPFNNPSSGIFISPEQQRENELQNYYWQQQQAEIAQQKAADKAASDQAELDDAVKKVTDERDATISELKEKYEPEISSLEDQDSTLKQNESNLENQRTQEEAENAHLRAKQLFQPKDPWREIDGKICSAKEADWFQFTGRVLEVKTNGILIAGDFGEPLEPGFGKRNYFVENFPNDTYPFADDEDIDTTMNFVAHMGGKTTFQYSDSKDANAVVTVRRLDYGKIVNSPPADLVQKSSSSIILVSDDNPQLTKKLDVFDKQRVETENKLQQLKSDLDSQTDKLNNEYQAKIDDVPNVLAKQAKDKEAEKKRECEDKALEYNQQAADKGDPYGLLRMGERYRDGDGVQKDLAKAKDYLTKAAAAGSPTAADELNQLLAN